MELEMHYYGDPVLRGVAEEITEITPEIRELGEAMLKKARTCDNWIGCAAPQVGALVRMFVVVPYEPGPDGRYIQGKPRLYLNPKLLDPTEETAVDSEGCLSIPGIYVSVERPEGITVEAMDLDGNVFQEKLHGYHARQIMHENDHLNGVLMVDRLPARDRQKVEGKLRALKKKTKQGKKK